MMDNFGLLKELLENEIRLLNKAEHHLNFTYQKCLNINWDQDIKEEDLELLDSLCSRFVRYYEVYLKNVLRTSLQIMRAHEDTFIDNMNKAEKIGLIDEMKTMDRARTLRNTVAHEYQEEEWITIFTSVIELVPLLMSSKVRTLEYIGEKILVE